MGWGYSNSERFFFVRCVFSHGVLEWHYTGTIHESSIESRPTDHAAMHRVALRASLSGTFLHGIVKQCLEFGRPTGSVFADDHTVEINCLVSVLMRFFSLSAKLN